MEKFCRLTNMTLDHMGVNDISEFQGMTITELREKYPRESFKGEFFEEMRAEGYFLDDELGAMIRTFPLSTRLINILERNGVMFVEDLRTYAYEEYQRFRNCGVETMAELEKFCKQLDIQLVSLAWIKSNMLGVYFDVFQLIRMFRQKIYYPEDFLHMSKEAEVALIDRDKKMPQKIRAVLKKAKLYKK